MAAAAMRRALPTDVDALLRLYGELIDGRLTAAPAVRAQSLPILEEILADPARHLMVAEVDGRVVGTADLLVVPNLTHHGMPWAIVENVVVAASARRRRVGTGLMQSLLEIAASAGCCKVQLLSGKHRPEAHAFYRNVGLDAVAEGFKLYLDE